MKKISICLLILFSGIIASAQSITITQNGETKVFEADKSEACNKEMVFMIVEQMPVYTGGNKQLEKDLNSMQISPQANGNITIWATINCKSEASGFKTIRTLGHGAEMQIIEHLQSLQNWQAGKQRGKEVDVTFMIKMKVKKGKVKIL